MANGFVLHDRQHTTLASYLREHILKPSTQFAAADALIFTAGRLEKASTVTATVDAILSQMQLPKSLVRPATEFLTTTLGEMGQYIPCRGNGLIFKTELTGSDDAPPANGAACASNASTSTIKITHSTTTSNGDFDGGTVFCPETGEQFTISTSTYSGGVHTLNLNKPSVRIITTGDTAVVVPYSKGLRTVKLSSGSSLAHKGIDSSVGGKTGGKVIIEDVFLDNRAGQVPYALVSFEA